MIFTHWDNLTVACIHIFQCPDLSNKGFYIKEILSVVIFGEGRDYTLSLAHRSLQPENAGKDSSGADMANNRRTTKLTSSGVIDLDFLVLLTSSTLSPISETHAIGHRLRIQFGS